MKKYAMMYTETYVHTFDVYAENLEQAKELAHKMIAAEEIDLSKGFCADSELSCVTDDMVLIPARKIISGRWCMETFCIRKMVL